MPQNSFTKLDSVTTLSFDLDDTLWSIGPTIARAEDETWLYMKKHYPNIARTFRPADIVKLRDEIQASMPQHRHDLTFLRKETIGRVLAQSGYANTATDELFDVYFDWRNKVDYFDDVSSCMELLSQRFQLIAITNGNADAKKTGIDQWFNDVIYARLVGVAKPAAKIFDEALKKANCSKDEIIHVGDHLQDDVLGAVQYGIGAAWVNRFNQSVPSSLPRNILVVKDLHQLCEAFGVKHSV